jgi:hypothetical protein
MLHHATGLSVDHHENRQIQLWREPSTTEQKSHSNTDNCHWTHPSSINAFRSVAFWAHALFTMSATLSREKPLFGNGRERNSKLFLECFDAVRKLRQCWNKWIVDDCWIDIVNERFDIPTQLQFAAADLNRAIGRDKRLKTGTDKAGDPSVNGVYKAQCFPSAEGAKKTT